MSQESTRFIAYELNRFTAAAMPLAPAPIERDWMDATDRGYAYRCLPLLIANQGGWVIQNPTPFTAWWDGTASAAGLHLEFISPAVPENAWTFNADTSMASGNAAPTTSGAPYPGDQP